MIALIGDTQIPLPSLTEEELAEQLEDIEKRVQLSAAALPSTAFYTFYNTHQALNCVNFSRNGNMLAGTPLLMVYKFPSNILM